MAACHSSVSVDCSRGLTFTPRASDSFRLSLPLVELTMKHLPEQQHSEHKTWPLKSTLIIFSTGEEKDAFAWYQQAELMHARWAMLGVAGMAAPELLGNPFVDGPLPNWAEAPFYDGYIADSNTLFVVKMFFMNWAEVRRWQDMKNPGSVHTDPYDESRKCTGKDVGYPGGGLFNPMGMAISSGDEKTLRTKEIANGRLAMVAAMGCFIQHDVTGVGPVANLKAHLADPVHINIFTNFQPFSL